VKRFYASLTAVAVVVSAIVFFGVLSTDSKAALPVDCDNNSIIKCGGVTAGELASKYTKNETGDLPAIYQSYGISASEMTHADTMAKMGEVRKDGTVVVNGEVVATDATSIGRQNIFSGSTTKSIGGKTFYDTPPSRSFARDSIVAYVFFDQNGDFKAAVLTSCGNPVSGKPKPKPKPVYVCNGLVAAPISRTEYGFTGSASASGGATIASYTFDFGDGSSQTVTNPNDVKHTYAKEGSYTITLTVSVKANGQDKTVTSAKCATKITITPEECKPGIPVGDERCTDKPKECKPGIPEGDARCTPCDVPGKEQYPKNSDQCAVTPVELPHTGTTDVIFGGIGLSAMIGAVSYWFASRRGLLQALLSR
jgi:LPXTG-motif cell wall-anchored protein